MHPANLCLIGKPNEPETFGKKCSTNEDCKYFDYSSEKILKGLCIEDSNYGMFCSYLCGRDEDCPQEKGSFCKDYPAVKCKKACSPPTGVFVEPKVDQGKTEVIYEKIEAEKEKKDMEEIFVNDFIFPDGIIVKKDVIEKEISSEKGCGCKIYNRSKNVNLSIFIILIVPLIFLRIYRSLKKIFLNFIFILIIPAFFN